VAPKKTSSINLLDTIIILVLAFTIDLFILWIAAQLRGRDLFAQLPPWLAQMSSSVWSWATGAAGTILLGWLRRRTSSAAATPNYLAWAGGGAVVILLAIAAVTAMVPSQPAPPSSVTRFDLKVQMRALTGDVSRVAFQQRLPTVKIRENIALQPDNIYYKATADFPERCQQFHANIYPVASRSELGGPVDATDVIFFRSPKDPQTTTAEVIVECAVGSACSISRDDLGWARPDDSQCKSALKRSAFGFGTVVYAQTPALKAQAGWRVPSLATLSGMKGRSVGYTRFSIASDSLKSLGPVDSFVYLIRVNGTPIYVDGATPDDMLEPVASSGRFLFEFGLENLNFSGSDNGCERLDVSLSFRSRTRTVRTVALSRKYAALRDADPVTIATDGLTFVWNARYVKPESGKEDNVEVFVASGTSAPGITRTKSRLDAAGLRFRGSRIVGVMRPPLNNSSFSLLAGLAQPSGQIKFTFDQATANALRGEIEVARKTAPVSQIIPNVPFLYRTKPGDAGTGTMNACRA
jgi:hypothetical protein